MSPYDMAMSRGDMANCAILFWMLMIRHESFLEKFSARFARLPARSEQGGTILSRRAEPSAFLAAPRCP